MERIFIYHDDVELQALADALDDQRSRGIKPRIAAAADVGSEYVHNRLVVGSQVHGKVVVEPVHKDGQLVKASVSWNAKAVREAQRLYETVRAASSEWNPQSRGQLVLLSQRKRSPS